MSPGCHCIGPGSVGGHLTGACGNLGVFLDEANWLWRVELFQGQEYGSRLSVQHRARSLHPEPGRAHLHQPATWLTLGKLLASKQL